MDALQYTIDVDDTPAQRGTARVNQAFDNVGEHAKTAASASVGAFATMSAAIVAASGHTERAFTAVGHATASFTHLVVKGTEAALALASSFAVATAAMAHFGAATAATVGPVQSLIDSLRVLRLTSAAALPEIFGSFYFAAASAGFTLLTEKAFELANARARLIEQQSILAAGADLKLEGSALSPQVGILQVQQATSAASLSGRDFPTVFKLQQALSSQFEKSPTDTRAALGSLGVSNYYQGVPSVAALKEIAEGFDRVVGAENRAAAAAKLFGKENVTEALDQLTPRFATAAGYVTSFGLTLDEVSQHRLDRFRKDLMALKEFFTDFSWFSAFSDKVDQVFVNLVARADDAVHRLDAFLDPILDKIIPERDAIRAYTHSADDATLKAAADRDLRYGNAGIKGFNQLNQEAIARVQSAATPGLLAQARASQAARDSSEEGIGARLSATRSRGADALRKLNEDDIRKGLGQTGLSEGDRFVEATAAASAAQSANLLEAQEKSVKATKEITKHQLEALRTSAELAIKSSYEPNAGRDLRGEILKGTQYINSDGEVVRFKLLDGTRRNLETAFHAFAIQEGKKASEETLKQFREEYDVRRRYEDDLYQKRLAYTRQTVELEIASDDKIDAHKKELFGYARDERLGALGFDRPQTVSGKLAEERQKLAIEQDYLLKASLNDTEKLTGDRDRKLADAAVDRFNNKIDDSQYFGRVKAIQRSAGVEGAAINDKFAHDNITAQQAAANASVQIVRDAQLKEFDSLKNSVEGVLNSMETRGVGVFQAIANSAKVSFLAAFNQIISSQIAATLFRILNPGQTVEFDHSGQGKGKFAGILGGLGLGTQPVFGGDVPGVTMPLKGNTDATDRNTAAIERNTAAVQQQHGGGAGQRQLIRRGGGGSFPMAGAAAAGFGAFMQLVPGLGFAGGSSSGGSGGSAVSEMVNYDTGGSEAFSSVTGGGSYVSGGESMGVPTGYDLPSAAGMSIPGVGPAGGGGKGMGGLLNMAALKGMFFNSGSISTGNGTASTAAGISQSLGGGALGKLGGGLAGFASSDAGGMIGAGLFLSGLQGKTSVASGVKTTAGGALLGANIGSKVGGLGIAGGALVGAGVGLFADGMRRGGFTGLGEDIAGGAAIGLQFGGPMGAAIGAAVGAVAGTIRLFFKGDRQHTKDLVQQIYGIKINNAMADEIMALAKQKYGGQISVAVRSQEVRDLLKLYAESIGSPSAKQFVGDRAHSASLVEFGGKMQQGAVYDNGQAYTYSSGLPTLNGIGSSALPTIGRYAGGSSYNGPVSVSLDPAQTEQLWKSGTAQGIQDNPRLVASAAVNGYGQSAGSSGNRAAVLSPSAIDR